MTAEEKQPPLPRKKPQQERSQRMVTAIIDSCKKILLEHGEESLSLPLLETVSGVTKGSIYQYFPNLEAVVAALYDREFEIFVAEGMSKINERSKHNTLDEELRFLIGQSIEWHKRINALHSSFYERYFLHYDTGNRFSALFDDYTLARDYIAPLIEQKYTNPPLQDPVEAAHLTLRLETDLFLSVLRHYPERLHSSEFLEQVLNTSLAFIEAAPKQQS